jgi:PKD repeat protein
MAHLFVFVGGCSSSDGDGNGDGGRSIGVTVTPSVTEGIPPLSVTFDVDGKVALTEPAIWDFGDGTTFESVGTRSVSHTFLESGTYNVTASFGAIGSDDLIVVATPITVSQNVNLVVSSFAIDREVTPGSLETISAIIQNIGTGTFTGNNVGTVDVHIDVGYFLSTDDIVTVDDIYIGDTSILIGTFFAAGDLAFGFESLAPGENYQFDHQLAVKGNIPAGTYYAGAIVDYIDEFDWYTFPRSTDTSEYQFPGHVVVPESNEDDNVRVLPAYQVTVTAPGCIDDAFEADDDSGSATVITVGDTQVHNFCFDNSDWLQFDAVQGGVYKITTSALDLETDTQLILYDTDGSSILLFHDNMGNTEDETRTVDLDENFPPNPASEIVWEAQATGTYYIKVRTTACDEDLDDHCETLSGSFAPEGFGSPDGVGLDTGYSISLQ